VSKVINTVVAWAVSGSDSLWYRRHMDRIPDYLWSATARAAVRRI
jgi:hypothetical protein